MSWKQQPAVPVPHGSPPFMLHGNRKLSVCPLFVHILCNYTLVALVGYTDQNAIHLSVEYADITLPRAYIFNLMSHLGCSVNETVLKKLIEWCEHYRGDSAQVNEDNSDSRKRIRDIDGWDRAASLLTSSRVQ